MNKQQIALEKGPKKKYKQKMVSDSALQLIRKEWLDLDVQGRTLKKVLEFTDHSLDITPSDTTAF